MRFEAILGLKYKNKDNQGKNYSSSTYKEPPLSPSVQFNAKGTLHCNGVLRYIMSWPYVDSYEIYALPKLKMILQAPHNLSKSAPFVMKT